MILSFPSIFLRFYLFNYFFKTCSLPYVYVVIFHLSIYFFITFSVSSALGLLLLCVPSSCVSSFVLSSFMCMFITSCFILLVVIPRAVLFVLLPSCSHCPHFLMYILSLFPFALCWVVFLCFPEFLWICCTVKHRPVLNSMSLCIRVHILPATLLYCGKALLTLTRVITSCNTWKLN